MTEPSRTSPQGRRGKGLIWKFLVFKIKGGT